MASAPEPSTTKEFTLAEVAAHKSERDIWMVIEGKVYALTEYLNDHPGGVEIMMQHAGKESTEAYNDIGHSKGARRILEKYQVGVLAPGEVVVKAPRAAAGAGGAGASLALYALGAAALAGALWYQFLRPAAAQ